MLLRELMRRRRLRKAPSALHLPRPCTPPHGPQTQETSSLTPSLFSLLCQHPRLASSCPLVFEAPISGLANYPTLGSTL